MLITTSHLGLLIILISILRASDTNHVSSSFKREPDLIRYKEPDYSPPKPFSFKNLIFKILGLEYDSDTDDDDDDGGGGESESSSSDKGPPSSDSESEDIIEKTPPKDLSSSSESDSETDMDIPRLCNVSCTKSESSFWASGLFTTTTTTTTSILSK
ncbi:uncharacterized protein J8A68_001801 [[Candida] subhashii]|uniref:Uncharacterized protein n=1 Tax=[Candida] subhashii TaxID=561895 RepID=A0A8J5QNE0_9ASCO|nr:uncharacterized protein J8A68_001801 [[Candida] subhashii]KAG7664704.1 hypothetical protein J8A68_001801 [[Candida] subhashii]